MSKQYVRLIDYQSNKEPATQTMLPDLGQIPT